MRIAAQACASSFPSSVWERSCLRNSVSLTEDHEE
jgi:hypothetical protein